MYALRHLSGKYYQVNAHEPFNLVDKKDATVFQNLMAIVQCKMFGKIRTVKNEFVAESSNG